MVDLEVVEEDFDKEFGGEWEKYEATAWRIYFKQLLLLNLCTTTTSSCWSTGLQEGAGVHQDHPAQRGLRHWGYLDGGVVTIVARLDKPIYYVGFSISRNLNL